MLIFLPGVIVMAVYLPLFWNNTGAFGSRQAVKSLYDAGCARRLLERVPRPGEDQRPQTIVNDPILGVGFGQPFQFVVPLPDLSWWPFWHYEPHHNILWVWLKTGAPDSRSSG